MRKIISKHRILFFIVFISSIMAGYALLAKYNETIPVYQLSSDFFPGRTGYLHEGQLPDSVALLPPPPAPGSSGLALDEEISRKSLAFRDSLRWQLAVQDADLSFPHAGNTFECALGVSISKKTAPHLYTLLRRTLFDVARSAVAPKEHYGRIRPFEVNHEPTCSPGGEKYLSRNGAYPSGHTALGWAWALILSEMAPDRLNEILIRGREFGESRIICNVHWYSDVVAGRLIGEATVARLHSNPEFQDDLAAAKSELEKLRSIQPGATRDCENEARVLHDNLL